MACVWFRERKIVYFRHWQTFILPKTAHYCRIVRDERFVCLFASFCLHLFRNLFNAHL